MARPNFFTTMKNFALQQPLEEWMILEFSQLGFIGSYPHQRHSRFCFCTQQKQLWASPPTQSESLIGQREAGGGA